MYNDLTSPSILATQGSEVLTISATNMDYSAALIGDKAHVVAKSTNVAGVLTIICNELVGDKVDTVVNIKSIAAPSGSNCQFPCLNSSTCSNGVCQCQPDFVGNQCGIEIKQMDAEKLKFTKSLDPFESVTVIHQIKKKEENELTIALTSKEKPRGSLLLNENEVKNK